MGIVVDLIILSVILLSTFLAYKKGLVALAIQLCAFVIAIIITFVLYQPVSNLVINATSIDETIENAIYEKADDILKEESSNNEVTSTITEAAKENMLPETARTLSINIVRAGVAIILFILVKIALKFVTALANLITKLPIINQFNKAGGLIYGLLRGFLIIYVALLIANVPGQISPNNTVNKSIDESYLGKTMYENNILNVLF